MKLILLPQNREIFAEEGQALNQALQNAGVLLDAPCGGQGTCGKCRCLVDGEPVLACQTQVRRNSTIELPEHVCVQVLMDGCCANIHSDRTERYVFAVDVGTTTVVAYLLDGESGAMLTAQSTLNPQTTFGGDVISRIQYALEHPESTQLRDYIRSCLCRLLEKAASNAAIRPEEIGVICIVGNTAMHHLLLGISPKSLTIPPYMPQVCERQEVESFLPVVPDAKIRILPNIAGFVGADMVSCMAAVAFDTLERMTLLIDIGTNGEMVLGNRERRVCCSTAAGPAFEGAKICFGMRGAPGAIDHVDIINGALSCSVIGGGRAQGICGSGLLDAAACMLCLGMLSQSGRMQTDSAGGFWGELDGQPAVRLCDEVWLTQKDIRELQLAKAAIRAGIELLMKKLEITPEKIEDVLLAGAFGNYLRPASACGIGLIPDVLQCKIRPIGNAAGSGAQICALNRHVFEHTSVIAAQTEYLELASLPEFQDCYVDCLLFGEEE